MSKLFEITYEAKVKRIAIVIAENEEEAKKKFDSGHGGLEKEIYIGEVSIVKNEELK